MKRYLFCLLVVLLLCVSAASAQDEELNLLTVGNLFKWTDTMQDVADRLNGVGDWTLSKENTGSESLGIQKVTDEKQSFCNFYFDAESSLLKEIECVDIFFSDDAGLSFADEVITAYDLSESEPYSDQFTASYTESLDGSMTVAGDETICILGGKDPSDEYYGFVALVFLNRAFY